MRVHPTCASYCKANVRVPGSVEWDGIRVQVLLTLRYSKSSCILCKGQQARNVFSESDEQPACIQVLRCWFDFVFAERSIPRTSKNNVCPAHPTSRLEPLYVQDEIEDSGESSCTATVEDIDVHAIGVFLFVGTVIISVFLWFPPSCECWRFDEQCRLVKSSAEYSSLNLLSWVDSSA